MVAGIIRGYHEEGKEGKERNEEGKLGIDVLVCNLKRHQDDHINSIDLQFIDGGCYVEGLTSIMNCTGYIEQDQCIY